MLISRRVRCLSASLAVATARRSASYSDSFSAEPSVGGSGSRATTSIASARRYCGAFGAVVACAVADAAAGDCAAFDA
jgi:hypothetical protein